LNGILNVNKPGGQTSFSVVAMVRRLSGERRVGHAGTLDSTATGVLPVCLGQGTRVIEFLVGATKTYRAEIELGVATDTYDASGKVTQRGDPSDISRENLSSALSSFRGLIEQTPPMYSALKYHGRRLSELARAGIEVMRKSRPIEIYRLDIIDWQPPLVSVEVVCGKGTYIRSLAHDLGLELGCGANLKSLVRLKYGLFDIKDAVSLSQLEDAFRYGYWQQLVYSIDTVLLHHSAVVVNSATAKTIKNGGRVVLGSFDRQSSLPCSQSSYRVYTDDGCFLGVLCFDSETGQWQPQKVFL